MVLHPHDFAAKAAELVSRMTLEEKAGLCSGESFWKTKGVERLGLQPCTLSDLSLIHISEPTRPY